MLKPFIQSHFLLFGDRSQGDLPLFQEVCGFDEGTAKGLFYKDPAPPPQEIENLIAPPSAPGDPIEAGVFKASNLEEDISIVINQGLGVDDDMEESPDNIPLVHAPAVDTLFKG